MKAITAKEISAMFTRHTRKVAEEKAEYERTKAEMIVDVKRLADEVSARLDEFNRESDNLDVMRVVVSWFADNGGKYDVSLHDEGHNTLGLVSIDGPKLYSQINGAGVLCGPDAPRTLWKGVGPAFIQFQQGIVLYPTDKRMAVSMTNDHWSDNGGFISGLGSLSYGSCVIRLQPDGRVGFGTYDGRLPKLDFDKAPDPRVLAANCILLASSMRRFLNSFRGFTHLVGLEIGRNYGEEEKRLANETFRLRDYVRSMGLDK